MNVQKGTEDILVPKAPKDFYCMVSTRGTKDMGAFQQYQMMKNAAFPILEDTTKAYCSDDSHITVPMEVVDETLDLLETRVSAHILEVSAYYESKADAAAKHLQELADKLDSYQRRFGYDHV